MGCLTTVGLDLLFRYFKKTFNLPRFVRSLSFNPSPKAMPRNRSGPPSSFAILSSTISLMPENTRCLPGAG